MLYLCYLACLPVFPCSRGEFGCMFNRVITVSVVGHLTNVSQSAYSEASDESRFYYFPSSLRTKFNPCFFSSERNSKSITFSATGRVLADIIHDSDLPQTHIARAGIIVLYDKKVEDLFESSEWRELAQREPPLPELDNTFLDALKGYASVSKLHCIDYFQVSLYLSQCCRIQRPINLDILREPTHIGQLMCHTTTLSTHKRSGSIWLFCGCASLALFLTCWWIISNVHVQA